MAASRCAMTAISFSSVARAASKVLKQKNVSVLSIPPFYPESLDPLLALKAGGGDARVVSAETALAALDAVRRGRVQDKKVVTFIGPAGRAREPGGRRRRRACNPDDPKRRQSGARHRAAGRSGVGAVMGSKKLKAIAVRGTGGVTVADREGFRSACLDALGKLKAGELTGTALPQLGTAVLVNVINEHGILPTRNFQLGQFEAAGQIRYNNPGSPGLVRVTGPSSFEVDFASPVTAAAPGQVAAVYDGETLLGGGWIDGAET